MRAYRAQLSGAARPRLAGRLRKPVCLRACMPLHIYQILNHYTPRKDLDPGFDVLDNSANERPDWFEYWPIRKFLLNDSLNEDAYYGFLSPKFRHKTNLTATLVRDFIGRRRMRPMCSCSARASTTARISSTCSSTASRSIRASGASPRSCSSASIRASRLDELVSDSSNTVHSNYFIAKPRFWRAWLAINERMFAIAESADDPLGEELRRADLLSGQRQRADEDIRHGARRHLASHAAIAASWRMRAIRSRRGRASTSCRWPSSAMR